MKYLEFSILILCFLSLVGCGKQTKDEKRDEAILSARISLTQGKCQEAIDTLESVGRDWVNADYLTTLSSAYSCRAGFSQIVFFATDVSKVDSSNIFGSFSTFTTSEADKNPDSDPKYSDNQTGLDLLLYAGNITSPSHAGRANYFAARDLGNISSQGIYLVAAQLGKFVKYYANVNSAGRKGLGGGPNTCYYTYTDVTALAAVLYLNTNTSNDTCDAGSPLGHSDLDINVETQADVKRRMCRGVILFNNFIDLFLGTTLSASSELTQLKNIEDDIESYISNCTVGGTGGINIGALCNVRSQSACESTATIQNLEIYFAAIFESLTI